MNPTGLIDRYALPRSIGGWIELGAGRGSCTIIALLSGTEVGRATVEGGPDAAHRIGFTLSFCRQLPPGCIAGGTLIVPFDGLIKAIEDDFSTPFARATWRSWNTDGRFAVSTMASSTITIFHGHPRPGP